jgi:gamma-tubulin complex component 2
LTTLVQRVLPLCTHYVQVSRLFDVRTRFEFGLVNHALCAAIRVMLKEYLVLVAQLEHQHRSKTTTPLTLLKLWFFIQPAVNTMQRLHRVTRAATRANASGGALLNVIHHAVHKEGDVQVRQLYEHLLSAASQPYFEMLQLWMCQGVIKNDDPYNEFQIKARQELTKENLHMDFNDTYWDERYTVRTDKLPVFLARYSDKVLTTGKYLNVIRESGRAIIASPLQQLDSLRLSPSDDRVYATLVEQAYRFASKELLHLLLHEKKLLARLRSIKQYFLMSHGDWYCHFLDNAEAELAKNVGDITPMKLKSLLELAVRSSKANSDPYKDDLSCFLQPYTLLQKLDAIHSTTDMHYRTRNAKNGGGTNKKKASLSTSPYMSSAISSSSSATSSMSSLNGLDAFTLSYQVRWPLSLIVSKKTLTKYQLLFRHLFFCKYVERQLCRCWINHQATKELNLRSAFMSSFALRHRMLHFLQNFVYYMAVEVLEPAWHELEHKLKNVQTVDDMLQFHNHFLDKCLKECLLTNQALLKILIKLMRTCLQFAANIDRFTNSLKLDAHLSSSSLSAASGMSSSSSHASAAVSASEAKSVLKFPHQQRQIKVKVESTHIQKIVAQKHYISMIERTRTQFDEQLRMFMKHLRQKSDTHYDHHLANLFTRMDYNGFYTNYFASGAAE